MSRYLITLPPQGEPKGDKKLVNELKADITAEAQQRKATLERFKSFGSQMEVTLTPDEVADDIMNDIRENGGFEVAKVSSRFGSYKNKYNLGQKKEK